MIRRYQKVAIAQGILAGRTQAEIARQAVCNPTTVKKFCDWVDKIPNKAEPDEEFMSIYEHLREDLVERTGSMQWELPALLPGAIHAIKSALNSEDDRLKAETAWKVLDRLAPPASSSEHQEASLTINVHAKQQLKSVFDGIADLTPKLINAAKPMSEDPHIHSDASTMLPSAPTVEAEYEAVDESDTNEGTGSHQADADPEGR